VTIFVDSSVWFAATSTRDHDNERAKSILRSTWDHVTTDHVLIETWLLLNSRHRRHVADAFWQHLQSSRVHIEMVTTADLQAAWATGVAFPDQSFSVVDRTSFAVMERLGITQAASFDDDFAIYRYGRNREKAFEIIRAGYSRTFGQFHRAIISGQQIRCTYRGQVREICPHVLGYKNGVETALVYQFGGGSSRALPEKGQWRCFTLSDVQDAALRQGAWHSGSNHSTKQRCVDAVYVDVNTNVPNQPGRRPEALASLD
jgi:predicted nucleic acid-binding protein